MTDKPYGSERTYPEDTVEESWREGESGQMMGRGVKTEFQDIHDSLTNTLKQDEDANKGPDGMFVLSQKTSGLIVEYFTIASAIIEQRSADLLYMTLVEDSRESKSARSFFQSNLQQWQREELLYRCGVIDEELKSNLKRARDTRNTLVHDLRERLYIEEDGDTVDDIDRALTAVEDLTAEYFRESYSN
jgi:hypothetical protein